MEDQRDTQDTENPAPTPDSGATPVAATFDLQQVIAQAKQILTGSAAYFQQMPRTGGYGNPVVFVAVMAAFAALVGLVFALFSFSWAAIGAGLVGLVLFPVFAIIGVFIGAAILFVIWKLMGSEHNYETAFRCLSSVTAIYPVAAVFSIVPYLGAIISVVWATYLIIEASVNVHGLERRKAQIVFAILGVLILLSNLSSEYASRKLADRMESYGSQLEDYEGMDAEQAGQELGKFLKGLEDVAREQQKGSGSD